MLDESTEVLSESTTDNILMNEEHTEFLCEEYVMGEENSADEDKEIDEDDEVAINEELIVEEHLVGNEQLVEHMNYEHMNMKSI